MGKPNGNLGSISETPRTRCDYSIASLVSALISSAKDPKASADAGVRVRISMTEDENGNNIALRLGPVPKAGERSLVHARHDTDDSLREICDKVRVRLAQSTKLNGE